MNQDPLATCHCIISHPTEPKFMAIKHDEAWSPPVVRFPAPGRIGMKAEMIAAGIMNKYGLKVTVLRSLVESEYYHCIELELQSDESSRRLKAVWVGTKEYTQFRSRKPGQADPFADWLADAERRRVPKERPAWERKGWFSAAAGWMQHELDRKNIQVTGSVQQFRVCLPNSAILRVRTSQGHCYFKAGHLTPPKEAEMTMALAKRWPQLVPEPLAVDIARNWMLHWDYGLTEELRASPADYSATVRSMAELQIDSLSDLDDWKELGCISRDAQRMIEFLGNIGRLAPMLTSGAEPFTSEQLQELESAASSLCGRYERLAAIGIPDTLTHSDFRPANLYRREGAHWVTDWADTMVAHPFFSLAGFVSAYEKLMAKQKESVTDAVKTQDPIERITEAYLQPFEVYASRERLKEALALVRELASAWQLCRWIDILPFMEKNSRASRGVENKIRSLCLELLK